MDRRTSEDEMDAGTGRGRSRLGAFARGAFLALALCALAAIAVILSIPDPGDLPAPGQIATPPVASDGQLAEGVPFSAEPGASPDAATGDTPPVASEAQLAEGVPFSAEADAPADAATEDAPFIASEAQMAEGVPFSAETDAPAGTATEDTPSGSGAPMADGARPSPGPDAADMPETASRQGSALDDLPAIVGEAQQSSPEPDAAVGGAATPAEPELPTDERRTAAPGSQVAEGVRFPDGSDTPGNVTAAPASPDAVPEDATGTEPPAEAPLESSETDGAAAVSAPPAGAAAPPNGAMLEAPQPTPPAESQPAATEPDIAAASPRTDTAASGLAAPAAAERDPPDAVPGVEDALAAAPAAEEAAPAPSAALAENARAFEAPRGTPLMAVVLVGKDVGALTADRLSLLTMPLTVAIPPDLPQAAEIGAAARAAGHEVLADLSLAEGAGAGPAADRLAALDMAIGATATDGGAEAEALGPVLAELDRQGLAWVGAGAGIGTPAERIARELGVAYTHSNRTVGPDASPDELHGAIDSAAHQAQQWGTSVLFLDAGQPALDALVRWGVEQIGETPVWFAPISAVIERRARG